MKQKKVVRLYQDEDGVVLLEFAMILPMMLILIAILISSGQIMISESAGYYGAFVSAREAMLPNASISAAEADGESVIASAPFGKSITDTVTCSQGSTDTVCTVNGNATLAFPILSFGANNNFGPISSFPFQITMKLPTQHLAAMPSGSVASDFSGLAGYLAGLTS